MNANVIKSPPDTTIYALALVKQTLNKDNVLINQGHIPNEIQISQFVGSVRNQVTESERTATPPVQSGNDGARKKAEHAVIEAEKFRADIAMPPAGNDYDQLNRQVENLLVCSDPPQSDNIVQMNMQNPQQSVFGVTEQPGLLSIGSGLSDDDFFHLTCHIEPSLIHKIEKGEFVELEKLLPKDRM